MESERVRQDSIYTQSLQGLFQSLWELNIPLDFLCSEDVISGEANDYRVLFATNLMVEDDQLGSALLSYVEKGGTLICDGKFCEISENGRLFSHIPGGPIGEVVGYAILETALPEMSFRFNQAEPYAGELRSFFEVKEIRMDSERTSVEARFDNDWPAVVKTQYGRGEIIHFATHVWLRVTSVGVEALRGFSKWLCERYRLHIHSVDDNKLKFATLHRENMRLVFVFNYAKEPVGTTLRIKVETPGHYQIENLSTGEKDRLNTEDGSVSIPLSVPDGQVQIIKISQSGIAPDVEAESVTSS